MRKLKSVSRARRFVTAHAAVQNLFNLVRHLVGAEHYRNLRISEFADWSRAVAGDLTMDFFGLVGLTCQNPTRLCRCQILADIHIIYL